MKISFESYRLRTSTPQESFQVARIAYHNWKSWAPAPSWKALHMDMFCRRKRLRLYDRASVAAKPRFFDELIEETRLKVCRLYRSARHSYSVEPSMYIPEV
jgi:hypothetical protein